MRQELKLIKDRLGWHEVHSKESTMHFLIEEVMNLCEAVDMIENDLSDVLSCANQTINQFSNEMVRLKDAASEVVGECGLNGSIEKLEAVLKELKGEETNENK